MFSRNLYFFKKNGDFVKNILGKMFIFFLAILTFYMTSLDVQQNFMPTRYLSFFLSLFGSKVLAFFCQKVAKVEHTICDCNWLSQDIQIN